MLNGQTLNGATLNGAAILDEEEYQLWLRNPSAAVAHIVEIDYHGTSAVYPNWETFTLKTTDCGSLSFTGYLERVKSIGAFSQQIGDKLTGVVTGSIGEIQFSNGDGALDSWHNLSIDGQRVRVFHGDPSWARERFRIAYECVAEIFASSTWDTLSLRVRGIDYKYNLPIQTNLIEDATGVNTESNKPVPLAFGKVFNTTPPLVDNVNLIYQWNDGAVTSVSDVRDSGVSFQTDQIAISAVSGDLMSTATAHGFYPDTRIRCDVGTLPVFSNWYAIAWNGDVFCAVDSFLSISATSPDGIVWTEHAMPTNGWSGISWNGSVFCAVSQYGVCATSPDGVTWTQRTMPSTTTWYAIEWNGSVFCAIANNPGTDAATSPDGITWTARTLPVSADWQLIKWNGSVFCAIANNSSIAATSPDGITWTQRAMSASADWRALAWNGSVFSAAAHGSTTAATSPDGITWTARTLPSSPAWFSMAWNGSVFCLVASSSAAAATSPDGITWTARTLPASSLWRSIAWNGTVFCTIGTTAYATTSPDGITWSPVTSTLPTPLTTNTDYWIPEDGLTTTAFKAAATRGGAPITLTNTTTGAALVGYHWTPDLTTGLIYVDSTPNGELTLDGVSGSVLASDILISVLSAINVDTAYKSYFDTYLPYTCGVYVDTRRNRLDVANELLAGIGGWYGHGREGLFRMGRVEGNPTEYEYALIADDFVTNSLQIERIVKPEKSHRIQYRRNYTNQKGKLADGVIEQYKALYSADYSTSHPNPIGTDEGSDGSQYHALAVIPDATPSQLAFGADAKTEASRLDAMYFGWGIILSGTVSRIGISIDVGDPVKITYPRYGLDAGVNTTCVYQNTRLTDRQVDLKFFVALSAYAPGQL